VRRGRYDRGVLKLPTDYSATITETAPDQVTITLRGPGVNRPATITLTDTFSQDLFRNEASALGSLLSRIATDRKPTQSTAKRHRTRLSATRFADVCRDNGTSGRTASCHNGNAASGTSVALERRSSGAARHKPH